jgi:beta-aspartyl-peptidase (threonine type)
MAVVVHGGAYAIPDTDVAAVEAGCKEAAEKAYQVLQSGKSALDAGMNCV